MKILFSKLQALSHLIYKCENSGAISEINGCNDVCIFYQVTRPGETCAQNASTLKVAKRSETLLNQDGDTKKDENAQDQDLKKNKSALEGEIKKTLVS